jgi:hypothetical protein
MWACSSAHYWARELIALGHEVKLMPPASVKPYVKRGKNDAADAEAICEAVLRPTMRFVPVKSAEQQANAMIYKVRELLVRQRTNLINALRSHLSEMGIIAAKGTGKLDDLIAIVRDQNDGRLPSPARQALEELAGQIEALDAGSIRCRKRSPLRSVRTRLDVGWRPFRVSNRSLQAHCWRWSPTQRGSVRPGTSPPGLALRRDKNPAAASNGWDRSANRAIATCEAC